MCVFVREKKKRLSLAIHILPIQEEMHISGGKTVLE